MDFLKIFSSRNNHQENGNEGSKPGNRLQRFLEAQAYMRDGYHDALDEVRKGRKCGHWVWYIFPQLRGLGYSYMSNYYGITGKEEALAYLENETLANRLREVSTALLQHTDKSAYDIFGNIDAIKVRSCMTLFDAVSPNDVFEQVLQQFYGGEQCQRTLKMLEA